MNNECAQNVTITNPNGTIGYYNPQTGESEIVDKSGEVLLGRTVTLKDGDTYRTREQREAYERLMRNKELNYFEKMRRMAGDSSSKEHFSFISQREEFKDLTPQAATRLIYLSTFTRYADNKLMKTKRSPMKMADLPEVLMLSKRTTERFVNEVLQTNPAYLEEDKDGELVIQKKIFKHHLNNDGFHYRFYNDGVRKLYDTVQNNNHAHLGYVFKMLPYINIDTNILCWNPYETAPEKIDKMTFREFAKQIGYDTNNIHKLYQIYHDLRFNTGQRYERFCKLIEGEAFIRGESYLCVNPRVLYGGRESERVKLLEAVFNDNIK